MKAKDVKYKDMDAASEQTFIWKTHNTEIFKTIIFKIYRYHAQGIFLQLHSMERKKFIVV